MEECVYIIALAILGISGSGIMGFVWGMRRERKKQEAVIFEKLGELHAALQDDAPVPEYRTWHNLRAAIIQVVQGRRQALMNLERVQVLKHKLGSFALPGGVGSNSVILRGSEVAEVMNLVAQTMGVENGDLSRIIDGVNDWKAKANEHPQLVAELDRQNFRVTLLEAMVRQHLTVFLYSASAIFRMKERAEHWENLRRDLAKRVFTGLRIMERLGLDPQLLTLTIGVEPAPFQDVYDDEGLVEKSEASRVLSDAFRWFHGKQTKDAGCSTEEWVAKLAVVDSMAWAVDNQPVPGWFEPSSSDWLRHRADGAVLKIPDWGQKEG